MNRRRECTTVNYDDLKGLLHNLIRDNKGKKFIIYPMGEQGERVKEILNEEMGIMEAYALDNKLCKQCDWIHPVSVLGELCCEDYFVLVTCENVRYFGEIIASLKQYNIDYYDLFDSFHSSRINTGGGIWKAIASLSAMTKG